MIKVITKDSYDELSEAANLVVRELLTAKPQAVIGLATGSSPLGLYGQMIKDNQTQLTDYRQVVTFNLDEYIGLAKDHPESYRTFMERNLFSLINIKEENTHVPSAVDGDDQNACLAYENLMSEYNIDLQVLGVGSNAHIGFNEPGTPFESLTHIVELAQRTRLDNQRFFNSLAEVPTHAITMGIASILKAKKILLVASGSNKAQAIYDMINGPISPEVPASILRQHPDVVVVIDKEAAAKL